MKILAIDHGQLVAFNDVPIVLHTIADIDALLAREDDVMRSSSLEFADAPPNVIALVEHLNSRI